MPNEPKPDHTAAKNNAFNPNERRNARRYALQAMYQWQIAAHSLADIEAEFIAHQIDKKLDLAYFKELIHEIPKHQTDIDQAMAPHLGRPLDEIDPVELAVLRIAIYELIKRPDIPYRVVINEALELTKKFGSVEGHKFVNGLLDKIAKNTRVIEWKKNK